MINTLKTALATLVADEVLKRVELAEEIEPEEHDLDEPKNSPSVLIYKGKTDYSDSDRDNRIRQIADRTYIVLLFCKTVNQDALEDAIVLKCLGLRSSEHDYPMQARGSMTVDISGEHTVRRIEFSSQKSISAVSSI